MSTEAALLAAIAADPDDDTTRLAYADLLTEKGGAGDAARAQFIRAQVELARPAQKGEGAKRRELLSTAKRLAKEHGDAWAAPVFDALGTKKEKFWREVSYSSWDRGFLNWLAFESLPDLRERAPAVAALTLIISVSLRKYTDADVRALAAEPVLRTVTHLNLFGHGWGENQCAFGDETAAVLAASPQLARLEEIDFTQNRLTTEGVRALAHSPVMTRLRKLRMYGNEVNDGTYEMLVASPLGPRLTDWEIDGSSGVTSEAAGILRRATHLTNIRVLSFSNTGITDTGVEALCAAPHLASVRELDFRNTNLSHLAVRALARSPGLANIERLNFVKTWINGFGARFLRESPYLKKVKFIALYDAVPVASQGKLRERFGRKVEFGRV